MSASASKTSAIFHRDGELPIQVLSKVIRDCRTNKGIMQRQGTISWVPEYQEAFNLMRKEITAAPILAYYNPRKQTVLQTDTSIKGLGTCLLQDQKPAYFASKALTQAWRGYVVIELKSLVVAWVMEKFHHFLYASHFILETDQKPLEVILSKSINQATPRLQRILIRTFPYYFTIRYIPGLTNQLADCLLRLGGQKDTIKLPKLHLYQITNQVSARGDSLKPVEAGHVRRWCTCTVEIYYNTRLAKKY